MDTCDNCEYKLSESDLYCANCGQKVHEKLGVKMLFDNTISNYLSVDSKLFKSLPYVLLKPGVLARKFVRGHRSKYMHPAKLFLCSSLLFFFLFSLATSKEKAKSDMLLRASFEKRNTNNPIFKEPHIPPETSSILSLTFDNSDSSLIATAILDSLIEANASDETLIKHIGYKKENKVFKFFYVKFIRFYKRKGAGITETMMETLPWAIFVALPLYAFILFLLFNRKEPYAHHLVLSFYQFSFLFLLMSIYLIFMKIIPDPAWISTALVLLIVINFIAGFRYFYRKKYRAIVLRLFALYIIFGSLLIPITAILIALITIITY